MVVTWKRLLRVRRPPTPADAAVAPSAPREEGGDDVGGEEDEEGEEGAEEGEEGEDEGMSSEGDAWATPEAARGEGAPETLVTSTKSLKAPDPPPVVEAQEGAQLASDAKPGSDDDDDDDDIWEDGPATAAVAPPAHIPAASRADDVFAEASAPSSMRGNSRPRPPWHLLHPRGSG